MKKIVILGCENSHANNFLKLISQNAEFCNVEVIGVYSDDREAAEKLKECYGVPVLNNYDDGVGKVDGVIVTARHGDNHFKYARPYVKDGVPMFIDKPITVSESDAIEMVELFRTHGVRFCGGSSLKHAYGVKLLRSEHLSNKGGKTLDGFVRAPYQPKNPYGDFYFYSQHLVEMVCEIFGRFPLSVKACRQGGNISVRFNYGDYGCTGLYVDGSYLYYASRISEEKNAGYDIESVDGDWFYCEFAEFYRLLMGGKQEASAAEFISPVFILNAIERFLESGEEQCIRYPEL